jgi:hypothetical protein
MKIHDAMIQGSLEWNLIRAGKVTASELDRLVSPLGKVRTGDGVKTYLMEKVAERWTHGPLPTTNFWDGDQGQFLEDFARPAFTLETGLDVRQVGFIESDDGRMGCSPDGLIGDDCGLEIKCPHLETHVRYLLDGKLSEDYILQVQGSLYVTGFKTWKFFSFRRGLPPLILTVEPDPKIQDAIADAMEKFNKALDEALDKLTELNGGVRPEPPAPLVQDEPTPAPEELQELTP